MNNEMNAILYTIEEETEIIKLHKNETLKEFYKYIQCDCVDIVEIYIDGEYFDIWVDDDGLLKERPIPNLYMNINGYEQILFGNLIFTRTNENGETIGLTDSQIKKVMLYIDEQKPKLLKWIFKRMFARK